MLVEEISAVYSENHEELARSVGTMESFIVQVCDV